MMERTNQRAFLRVPFRHPVQLKTNIDQCTVGAVAYNLSSTGVLVDSPVFIGEGKVVEVSLELPNQREQINLLGRVARIAASVCEDRYQLGIAFNLSRSNSIKSVSRWIRNVPCVK